jgi:hypothetical protein
MIRLAGVNGVARIASRAFNFFVFEIDLRVSADCVVTIRHRPAFKGRGIADYCGRVRSDANPNEQSESQTGEEFGHRFPPNDEAAFCNRLPERAHYLGCHITANPD